MKKDSLDYKQSNTRVFSILGASNHSEFERVQHDYIYEMGTLLGLDNYKKYKGFVTW